MTLAARAFLLSTFAGLFVVGAAFLVAKFEAPSPNSYKRPSASASPQTADIIAGGKYYQLSCARCHAADAHGNDKANVPSLVNDNMSDGDMIAVIEDGSSPMPAFKSQYNPQQTKIIVKYLRSLK
jgi:mono/diheme cytochrome c family protein